MKATSTKKTTDLWPDFRYFDIFNYLMYSTNSVTKDKETHS